MEIIHYILLIAHFVGLALIIGPFFVQMRWKAGFKFLLPLIGAVVQLVSGLGLVGVAYASGNGEYIDNAKIAVKLVVLLIVLAVTIIGYVKQGKINELGDAAPKPKAALPFLHIAGAGAILNVILAVVWR